MNLPVKEDRQQTKYVNYTAYQMVWRETSGKEISREDEVRKGLPILNTVVRGAYYQAYK